MADELKSLAPRRAKLRPPRIASDVIARPRLVAQLDRLSTLSLVIAPAGYGKTTLISLWLAEHKLPYAWISLDEEDNTPAQFLLDMMMALRTVEPGFGQDVLGLLNAPSEPPFALLTGMLTNELDALEQAFVLVLDDYHVIQDPVIHSFVVELVSRPPRRMHVVMASRHDPPLPQHLRVRSAACEIRAQELSFTPAETSAFLAKILDRTIDEGEASAVALQSEGWVASVRLMGLYARHQPHALLRGEPWRGSARQVLDYLSTAVLDVLPEEVRTFLIRTSILERLSGPLCDAVMNEDSGAGRSAVLLQQLVDDGIFTVVLDEDGGWYRYHTLFRQVLQRLLAARDSADEIIVLHGRAGAWYEQHDLLEEALDHALAAGQMGKAVALVGRHRHRLLDGIELRRLERWLALFPPEVIASEIELLMARAWVAWWRFSLPEASGLVRQVQRLLAEVPAEMPQRNEWLGELAALRSEEAILTIQPEDAVREGMRALEMLSPDRLYVPSVTRIQLAIGLQMAGKFSQSLALAADVAANPNVPRDLSLMASHHLRLFVEAVAADLESTLADAPAMLAIANERKLSTSIAWANYFVGCTAYLQNDLAMAGDRFRAVVELRYHAHALAYGHSAVGLALTYEAQGRPKEAVAVVKVAEVHFGDARNSTMLVVVSAFAAELAARQGRMDEARRWLAREKKRPDPGLLPLFYLPPLAAVRILLAAGTKSDLVEAAARLDSVSADAVRLNNVHAQIQCAALAAAIHGATGDRPQAHAALKHALELAEPGRVVRVFVDLGAFLRPLLADLAAGGAMTAFAARVGNLVEAVRSPATGEPTAEAASAPAAVAATQPAPPPEADQLLTFREVDVLRLLEQRLTNKEIGQQLGISTDTVKQHTVNLFRKLQVDNRRQAVVAGRARGYLNGG